MARTGGSPTLDFVYPKSFNKIMSKLSRGDAKSKAVFAEIQSAFMSWAKNKDAGLPTTAHGESRISNIRKYDLQGFYRLVMYEHAGVRYPLFAGDHEDVEKWLNSNKGKDFHVDRGSQQVLHTSLPAKTTMPGTSMVGGLEDLDQLRLQGPVLAAFPVALLEEIGLPRKTLSFVRDAVKFENISDETIWMAIEALEYPSDEHRDVVLDVISKCCKGLTKEAEFSAKSLLGRITSATESPTEFHDAMVSEANRESHRSLTNLSEAEIAGILDPEKFSDWMLYLHPDQENLVERDFSGPARLLGVSGSGKTCVLVHRAKRLARKYPGERILILTLGKSLVRLINHLVSRLCPEELQQVEVYSIRDYFSRLVKVIAPDLLIRTSDPKSGETLEVSWKEFLEKPHVQRITQRIFSSLELRVDSVDPQAYVYDELVWIRSGFSRTDRSPYLTCERIGRGIPLPIWAGKKGADSGTTPSAHGMPADIRPRLLDLLGHWEDWLATGGLADDDGVAVATYELKDHIKTNRDVAARCVLVDEVQDVSTIELSVIATIPTEEANGLFLCGDPVQKVFPKQSHLPSAGIDIVGRGTLLKKNYRNTRQILQSAFTIIEEFAELAAIPQADIISPEFADRHGEAPFVYNCRSREDEVRLVIEHLRRMPRSHHDATCIATPSAETLDFLENECVKNGFECSRLSGEDSYEAKGIKLSNLENVKGHEFLVVFLLDLSDKLLPSKGMPWEERWRDAFHIYVAMTRARDHLYMSYVYNRTRLIGPLGDTVQEHESSEWD